MPPDRYPSGTVHRLLPSQHLSAATRAALTERLTTPIVTSPRFFSQAQFATLRAVCARLTAQDLASPVDLAGPIDARLANGTGDGWRYDALPPDGDAYRLGLDGLEELAHARGAAPFVALAAELQDELLATVQRGEVDGGVWTNLPPTRFFEELLAETVELYYSHPLAQDEIGYVGFADLPGWTAIGLDEREPREPRPEEPSCA